MQSCCSIRLYLLCPVGVGSGEKEPKTQLADLKGALARVPSERFGEAALQSPELGRTCEQEAGSTLTGRDF